MKGKGTGDEGEGDDGKGTRHEGEGYGGWRGRVRGMKEKGTGDEGEGDGKGTGDEGSRVDRLPIQSKVLALR